MSGKQTDRAYTVVAVVVVVTTLVIAGVGIVSPKTLGAWFQGASAAVINYGGWWYILAAVVYLIGAVYICTSPLGRVRLGARDERPEFSFFSWFSMMFACGYGASVIFWGIAAPLTVAKNPPANLPAGVSPAEWGMAYIYLWDIIPGLMMYTVVAAALGLVIWRRGLPWRMSSALYPLLGPHVQGLCGWAIDAVSIFAIVGGISTTAGLTAWQLGAVAEGIFGIPASKFLFVLVFLLLGSGVAYDALTGIHRGIRIASELTTYCATAAALLLFILGPTLFDIELGLSSLGVWVQYLPTMLMWLDPIERGLFPQSWTGFWWAWWISWSIFVGSFCARVSRGRTLRELLLGLIAGPAVFLIFQHMVYGGSAVYYAFVHPAGVIEALDKGLPYGLVTVLQAMPFSVFTGALFAITLAGYFITSADSAAYMIACIHSGRETPSGRLRAFWVAVLMCVGLAVKLVGGFEPLQASSILAALPFSIVLVAMVACCVKEGGAILREECDLH